MEQTADRDDRTEVSDSRQREDDVKDVAANLSIDPQHLIQLIRELLTNDASPTSSDQTAQEDEPASVQAGCVLWDMAMLPEVGAFLVGHTPLSAALLYALEQPSSPSRLLEVCLGILANLLCHVEAATLLAGSSLHLDALRRQTVEVILRQPPDPDVMAEGLRALRIAIARHPSDITSPSPWLHLVLPEPTSGSAAAPLPGTPTAEARDLERYQLAHCMQQELAWVLTSSLRRPLIEQVAALLTSVLCAAPHAAQLLVAADNCSLSPPVEKGPLLEVMDKGREVVGMADQGTSRPDGAIEAVEAGIVRAQAESISGEAAGRGPGPSHRRELQFVEAEADREKGSDGEERAQEAGGQTAATNGWSQPSRAEEGSGEVGAKRKRSAQETEVAAGSVHRGGRAEAGGGMHRTTELASEGAGLPEQAAQSREVGEEGGTGAVEERMESTEGGSVLQGLKIALQTVLAVNGEQESVAHQREGPEPAGALDSESLQAADALLRCFEALAAYPAGRQHLAACPLVHSLLLQALALPSCVEGERGAMRVRVGAVIVLAALLEEGEEQPGPRAQVGGVPAALVQSAWAFEAVAGLLEAAQGSAALLPPGDAEPALEAACVLLGQIAHAARQHLPQAMELAAVICRSVPKIAGLRSCMPTELYSMLSSHVQALLEAALVLAAETTSSHEESAYLTASSRAAFGGSNFVDFVTHALDLLRC